MCNNSFKVVNPLHNYLVSEPSTESKFHLKKAFDFQNKVPGHLEILVKSQIVY